MRAISARCSRLNTESCWLDQVLSALLPLSQARKSHAVVASMRRRRLRAAVLLAAAAHCHALSGPPALPELRMTVKDCGSKGLGAFAAEDRSQGQWVCDYRGEVITFAQRAVRYVSEEPEYLFHLGGGAVAGSHVYIDAVDSDHASRAINHAQDACLEPRVTLSERRVAFYALKDIKAGDELSFDYGEQYWLERGLAPEDDSRDYSPERVARERRKLADAQAASSSLQNPLSRRRRRGRAPSTAEELARVLGERPERPDP